MLLACSPSRPRRRGGHGGPGLDPGDSQPDDAGAPVALDGGVNFPEGGCANRRLPRRDHQPRLHRQVDRTPARTARELAASRLRRAALQLARLRQDARRGRPDGSRRSARTCSTPSHWLNDPASPVVGGMVTQGPHRPVRRQLRRRPRLVARASANDPAVRTVVPTATWTDIYDALLPNDVALLAYANGFYATGFEPTAKLIGGELSTTNNYSANMHRWVAQMNGGIDLDRPRRRPRVALGHRPPRRRSRSRSSWSRALNDGLFSANQAIDAYRALARPRRADPALRRRHRPPAVGRQPRLAGGQARRRRRCSPGSTTTSRASTTASTSSRRSSISRADYFDNDVGRHDALRRRATRSARRRRMHLCTTRPDAAARCRRPPCPDAAPAALVNGYAGRGWNQDAATAGYAEELKAASRTPSARRFPDLLERAAHADLRHRRR